ncbi:Quinol monooxygenase YgiN [Saccharopolyspora antimicrobica]|uniref:Quinol monooxygenase YgiN n=1 Tax=Saccharopolyspora antimicrobica TaxID=455193 RepID=A0A1I4RS11_9PSEU|nr:putative quinol monooxygenase [Saccharopolyspora antimicrobica]RKT87901.1 quinol monooxygenase YgiN [Saccharopolyspora antimicrobica]SFM54991.1 Quinol monooxygenase YgiN [Saccharopolyspora antimicrobica]
MGELFIVAGLRAKEGKDDELRRDLAELVELSRQEEGSIRYDLFVSRDEPGLFVLVEHWASEEARSKHHNESSHIQRFHGDGKRNVERTEFFHMLDRVV